MLPLLSPMPVADFSQDNGWIWLLKAVGIIVFLLVSVLFALWFERRLVARMQLRPGPNWHGPFGSLQSFADAGKLLFKEDVTVKAADKVIYILAPMISVTCSLLIYAVIPFGPAVNMFGITTPLQLTDFSGSVLYILGVTALGVYGIVLGGWSSGSTYPLLGAVRSTAQIISYELSMSLALVAVIIMSGSMATSSIVEAQASFWWAVTLFPAFILYVISMVGETNRLPFDLPEAEGELVSGFMTEYSSMKFAWFFLAEYINMLNVSAVATTLFLGGWRAPWPLSAINDGMFNTGWWPFLWFVVKVWMFMFLFVWIRGSLLRFRYDQFMKFGWKVLIPIGLAFVVCVATIQVLRVELDGLDLRTPLMIAAGVVLVIAIATLFLPERKQPAPEVTEPEPFDAFADGYPVPPLPGQSLPPSPRAGRRAAAAKEQGAATAVLLEAAPDADVDEKESDDD
ncbi:MAG: NADH-quinone oxidoreductase subunit NuoH [Actinomycetales bacterium]|nr:NADH-quinone oxidoreductase subunit NuoH [Actinomycetales bacterium]